MSLISIFESAEASIKGFFAKEQPIVVDALTKANGFINIVKVFGTSATGQTITTLLEMFVPAASVVKIVQVASVAITDLGLVTAEVSKTPEQILLDGVTKAASLTGNSKIIAFSNLATIVGTAISDVTGGTLTTPQAISINQIVHDPAALGAPVVAGATK
jgi:hypothetical protein